MTRSRRVACREHVASECRGAKQEEVMRGRDGLLG